MSEGTQIEYMPGDCVVEELGEIKLADGRVFKGAILTFPAGPPKLPITVVWDRTPLSLTIAAPRRGRTDHE